MRDHTTPIFQELLSQGSESVALTPGAAQQRGTFTISGIEPVAPNGQRNYCQGHWLHLATVVDPDAAGNAVSADKLGKVLASARLFSPTLGEQYPAQQTRGSVLYHFIQVLGLGYAYPSHARAQIPASTDTDVSIELYYFLPQSYEFLKKPHETSQWVGFFDQGQLDGTVDVSTCLDGDYAGAVIKATTALRAWMEYAPSPDDYLGVPFQWRDREIAGGGSQPVLQAVGNETQLTGVRPGCGLAALFWLTDATGIGLGGPDGVDNFTSVEVPWRNQRQIRNLDAFPLTLRRAAGRRVGPVAGTGTTIIHDGAGWPSTMDATPNGRAAANAALMALPLVFPGRDAETSKFQRVSGNLKVNFGVTTPISAAHRFLSLEFMEYTEAQIDTMFRAMGISPDYFNFGRKALLDNAASADALRFTRILATPRAA